jgi:hypothetical protein
MTKLYFHSGEHWDDTRQIVKFGAMVGTKQILCGISSEALGDHFGGDADPIKAFRSNRAKIEAIAERLIEQGRFEQGRLILIKTDDLSFDETTRS